MPKPIRINTNLHPNAPATAMGKLLAESARKQRLASIRNTLDQQAFFSNASPEAFLIIVRAEQADVLAVLSPLQKEHCQFMFDGRSTIITVVS